MAPIQRSPTPCASDVRRSVARGAATTDPQPSSTHVVLIPSFNTGPKLLETVRSAIAHWRPVWVVIDGSTDGSDEPVRALASDCPGLRVLRMPRNQGKGAAIFAGLEQAEREGFTHVLTMDADGQHPADRIPDFIGQSRAAPHAMILGVPEFDASAPLLRVRGRRVSNAWAKLETLGWGVGDSLFGLRVYPVPPLLAIMRRTRWMRRYDFDAEAAVRLAWAGVPAINIPAAVRYFTPEEGGVSHFRYGRDNALLTWMHMRLVLEFLLRLPLLVLRRWRGAGFSRTHL